MLLLLVVLPATRYWVMFFINLWLGNIGRYEWTVGLAVVMLLCVHLLNTKLKQLHNKWLEWSLFGVKANVSLLPLERKWSGLAYAALLYCCIPTMACFEEAIFRTSNHTIEKLLWGVLAFGFAHLLALVTVRMACVLALLGGVLVVVYQVDGLVGACMVHATYNLITLSVIVFELRVRVPAGKWLAQHRFATVHLPTVTFWLLKPSQEWYA
jgi:hypothetical protein